VHAERTFSDRNGTMIQSHRTNLTLAASALLLSAFANPAGAVTAPDWVTSLTPGTWSAVSTNTLSSVNPGSGAWSGDTGQAAVCSAWNGGALAKNYGTKGALIAWGGGHHDYYGNEVYAFDLDTRRWSRLTDPYPNPSFPVSSGLWPDGSPSVTHTYAKSAYHPGTNSFMSVNVQTNNDFSQKTVPVFFDLGSRQWRHGPADSQQIIYGGWTVYDAKRDAFWSEGGDSGGVLGKFTMNGNGTSGSWTNFGAKLSALDSNAAIDPGHDFIAITTFRQNSNVYGLDLNNPSGSLVTLKQGGSSPSASANGWEWSDLRQAFIFWRRGSGVYEFKLSGSDWKTGTWNWTNLTAGGNSVTPQDQSNGVYNRFRLMRYDDAEIAVVVNSVTGSVYAFRMPGSSAPAIKPKPPSSVQAQ
jgi:hypothetical protein